MKRLVLFDIDGTLIRDNGASRAAYAIALEAVFGHSDSLAQYDFSGRTDPQITHMVMGDAGFSRDEIDARLGALWEVYTAELAMRATRASVETLPGVTELLEELARDSSITLALLTGNIERGARLKLAPPGLNDYFRFGAFGSDHHDREQLPPVAVRRAQERDGVAFTGRDVVIIGDSIYDVRCGVPHGATTIAVASGRTSADALRAERPDFFTHTLEPAPRLLDVIRGS